MMGFLKIKYETLHRDVENYKDSKQFSILGPIRALFVANWRKKRRKYTIKNEKKPFSLQFIFKRLTLYSYIICMHKCRCSATYQRWILGHLPDKFLTQIPNHLTTDFSTHPYFIWKQKETYIFKQPSLIFGNMAWLGQLVTVWRFFSP